MTSDQVVGCGLEHQELTKPGRTIVPTMVKAIGGTKRPCNQCQATMKDSTRGSIVVRGLFKRNCFRDSKNILVEVAYIG